MRLRKRRPFPSPTHEERFALDTGYRMLEQRFVNFDDQYSVDTATWWTLHLRCDGEASEVQYLADLVNEREFGTAMLGGDSFHEWCEPYQESNDKAGRALHVLFRAPSSQTALLRARMLCRQLGEPWVWATHTYLTTAADWAEGFDVFPFAP